MDFSAYVKDKAPVLLLHAAALFVLSIFLWLVGNSSATIILIDGVWLSVLAAALVGKFCARRAYFSELTKVLEELPQRYLIAEVMKPGPELEDRLYWEVLRRSNKAVIDRIHEMENAQKEYKEYVESWVHEVKTPLTAIHLLCENHREAYTGRILLELDDMERDVEKILYYARMEQVYQDYLIHPVNLKKVVLSAISREKRHFMQCGMQIDLQMEDCRVSTDEKWVEFILRQIFSNSMKYARADGAKLKIWVENGERQKSLFLEDNGCGIVREDLGRVFDKGFTGRNGRRENGRATGMGLYLCRRLCEKLDMGIACESEEGVYTRVILTFPDSDFHRGTGTTDREMGAAEEILQK